MASLFTHQARCRGITTIDSLRGYRIQIAAMVLLVCIFVTAPASLAQIEVFFPDPNLEAVIRATLQIPTGPIYDTDMETITWLDAGTREITNLGGIEYLHKATWIFLGFNSISDLSPLASLASLNELYLPNNSITDTSPLADLTNLTGLRLSRNFISDLSPLAGLTNLSYLDLNYCSMDLPPPAGVKSIDLNALADLTNLRRLLLAGHSISDLSSLVGLSNLNSLMLSNNSISDLGLLAGLTSLTHLSLGGNSIHDLTPLANLVNLEGLGVAENSISDLSPLTGLGNLTSLTLAANAISDLGPLAGLTNLTYLNLQSNVITNIAPLAGLTNLDYLDARDNRINNISPLAELTSLNCLDLRDNSISDVSSLAELSNLTELELDNNNISDLSPLVDLINLPALSLSNNAIADLGSLAGATHLHYLFLSNNSISDLSPLAELTNLSVLHLNDNSISDLDALAGLPNLRLIELHNNSISDLSALLENSGLGYGDSLYLEGNSLSQDALCNQIPVLESRDFWHLEYDGFCGPPALAVAPESVLVSSDASSTSITITNIATGTMPWYTVVTSEYAWLTVNPESGTDTTSIVASYEQNSSRTGRTGIITVVAPGATGSPATVTITQGGCIPPESPTGLRARDGADPNWVLVSWDGLTGDEFEYRVLRSTSTDVANATPVSDWIPTRFFYDPSAAAPTIEIGTGCNGGNTTTYHTYYYWVIARAVGDACTSDPVGGDSGYRGLPESYLRAGAQDNHGSSTILACALVFLLVWTRKPTGCRRR